MFCIIAEYHQKMENLVDLMIENWILFVAIPLFFWGLDLFFNWLERKLEKKYKK